MSEHIQRAQEAIEALLLDPRAAAPSGGDPDEATLDLCTAVLAAVAARYLAVARPRTLGVVGLSPRSDLAIAAHQRLYDGVLAVRVACDDRESTSDAHARVKPSRALACDIVLIDQLEAELLAPGALAPGAHVGVLGGTWSAGELPFLGASVFHADSGERSLGRVARGERLGRTGSEITVFDARPTETMRRAVSSLLSGDKE